MLTSIPTSIEHASYLSMEDIVLDLDVLSVAQLFDAVDKHMSVTMDIPTGPIALHLRNRERIGSTGLGKGVAVPHARVKNLSDARLGYFRLKTPIDFSSEDKIPVSDVFVLLVPEQANERHLEILASLCSQMASEQFRTRLHACESANDVAVLFAAGIQ